MKTFLSNIRAQEKSISVGRQVVDTAVILFLGIALGVFAKFAAGFFPGSYAMIWAGFTVVSPLPAFICWYAKGKSKVSFALSAMILAVLFNMTFVYGI